MNIEHVCKQSANRHIEFVTSAVGPRCVPVQENHSQCHLSYTFLHLRCIAPLYDEPTAFASRRDAALSSNQAIVR